MYIGINLNPVQKFLPTILFDWSQNISCAYCDNGMVDFVLYLKDHICLLFIPSRGTFLLFSKRMVAFAL